MSYPPYGPPGGYPAAGGYGGQPGYPAQPGYPGGGGYPTPQVAMPTPESAGAGFGGGPGGLPYTAQPGGPPPAGFSVGGGGYLPPSVAMPSSTGANQPTFQSQAPYGQAPGFGGPPQAPGGYPGAGGYPAAASAGGYPGQQGGYPAPAGGYGAPPQPAAGGYGAPPQPAAGGYGAPPQPVAGGYGAPPQPAAGGYGAPPQPGPGGYGAPPQSSAGGYGAPPQPGGYGAPPQGQQQSYGGYGNPGVPTGGSNVPGPANYKQQENGTLRPLPNFNAEADSQILRKAMKGFGTDEKAIIDVLSRRCSTQRQQIKLMYKTCFGRDLINDLKSELGGNFEDACVALLMRSDEYDAYELRRAMRGAGTDEEAMIEILSTRNNQQIRDMTAAYKTMYGRKLEDDILSETSGHFRKLLVALSAAGRMENQPVDRAKATADAQALQQAGEKRWGTDENTFNRVMCSQSYEQLRCVFDEYTRISNHDIERTIGNEMSGNLARGMVAIIRCVRNRAGYFADVLYQSMKGMGTEDRTLVRVIVSRCEVDMVQIKQEFQRRYGKTLEAFISGDISGDYKRLLLGLVTG